MTSGTYSKTTMMILCGIFAAVTAICSLITIPLGFTPVPVNLGTLSVFLTGGILGKNTALSAWRSTSCWAPQVSPFSQDSEAA